MVLLPLWNKYWRSLWSGIQFFQRYRCNKWLLKHLRCVLLTKNYSYQRWFLAIKTWFAHSSCPFHHVGHQFGLYQLLYAMNLWPRKQRCWEEFPPSRMHFECFAPTSLNNLNSRLKTAKRRSQICLLQQYMFQRGTTEPLEIKRFFLVYSLHWVWAGFREKC